MAQPSRFVKRILTLKLMNVIIIRASKQTLQTILGRIFSCENKILIKCCWQLKLYNTLAVVSTVSHCRLTYNVSHWCGSFVLKQQCTASNDNIISKNRFQEYLNGSRKRHWSTLPTKHAPRFNSFPDEQLILDWHRAKTILPF